MRVLVNNIKCTNSTLLVKFLKRIKSFPVEVFGSDIYETGYISSSTFVDKYFKSPSMDNEEAFIEFLNDLYYKYKIDFLFVSTDKEVRLVNKYKDNINIPFINPPSETIAIFQDKLRASYEIEKIGLKVPNIYSDIFGKEKIIFRKKQSVSSQGIYIVDLSKSAYIENHFSSDWFAQEYISGTKYVIDVFANEMGKPQLIIPRMVFETQSASAFRSQTINNNDLIEQCKYIYSKFIIPGLSNIEFIENENGYHFIEINLRIGGSASAGIISSFNYIEQFLDHFVNGNPLEGLDTYMKCVAWNSIISRYYEETIILKCDSPDNSPKP